MIKPKIESRGYESKKVLKVKMLRYLDTLSIASINKKD